MFIRNLTMKKL